MTHLLIGTIFIILGMAIATFIAYLITSPKIKQTQQRNQRIINENKEAEEELKFHLNEIENAKLIAIEEKRKNSELMSNNFILAEKLKNQNEELENNYSKTKELYNDKLKSDLKELNQKFKDYEDNYKQEFLNIINDSAKEYNTKIGEIRQEFYRLNDKLEGMKNAVTAATEERKRAAEMKDKENFYKIQLSDNDKNEIKKIREIIPYLSQAEPINKVIWTVYYKNPTSDMIGRVVGNKIKTGIYKITNLENGMSYVGQAVDIKARFTQHIKRGVGAETPTRNKLYPAMYSIGPENFTFEIIEECDRSKLDEREDYWQDYYKSIEYGYSIK